MFSRYKQYIRFGVVTGLIVSALMVFALTLAAGRQHADAAGERDCDATSVIYCGALTVDELINEYNAGGTKKHYDDIPAIYDAFGISSAELTGLKTKVGMGQVKADGTVWLNGVQIGSGAVTAGRVKTTNSTAIAGTGAYKRPPSDSFARSTTTIDAFIGYDAAGQPAWAVLASCGNPINFTPVAKPTPPPAPAPAPAPAPTPQPTPNPSASIEKKVKDPKTGQWVKEASFEASDTIEYQIVVNSTGPGPLMQARVWDALPPAQTYEPGSTMQDGAVIADNMTTDGVALGTVPVGKSITFTFKAKFKVSPNLCGVATLVNMAKLGANDVPTTSSSATTKLNVKCAAATCTNLTVSKNTVESGEKVTVTAKSQTENTSAAAYAFTVNGNEVQNGPSNGYVFTKPEAGTYTVASKVKFADGTTSDGNGNCSAVITVKAAATPTPTPPAPTPTPPAPCTITGKESLPASSSECILPQTGIEGVVGVFIGTSTLAGLGYYFVSNHKRTVF